MPIETRICNVALIVGAQRDLDVIATQRVIIRKLDIMRIQMPAIAGVFIMLDDYFTVEVVHTTPMSHLHSLASYARTAVRGGVLPPKQSPPYLLHKIASGFALAMTDVIQTIPSLCRSHSQAGR